MMMMNAPIWIWAEEPEVFDGMGFWQEREADDLVEYVRADIHANALEEIARLREALEWYGELRNYASRNEPLEDGTWHLIEPAVLDDAGRAARAALEPRP